MKQSLPGRSRFTSYLSRGAVFTVTVHRRGPMRPTSMLFRLFLFAPPIALPGQVPTSAAQAVSAGTVRDTLLFVPGARAEVVGVGTISREWSEFGAAFTDAGRTMYFAVTDALFSRMTILSVSAGANGSWNEPTIASFSGEWNDGDVSARPDGKRLFFISNRPVSLGDSAKADLDIWFVDRTSDGRWSAPRHAGQTINSASNEVYPTATAAGVLYFGRPDGVYRALPTLDGYGQAEKVADAAAAVGVSPDERFLVVGVRGKSPGDVDLAVRYREGERWGPPIPLSESVNSSAMETAPAFSPDGTRLYFASNRRASPIEWPRSRPIRSVRALGQELSPPLYNGLRNLYVIDLARSAAR